MCLEKSFPACYKATAHVTAEYCLVQYNSALFHLQFWYTEKMASIKDGVPAPNFTSKFGRNKTAKQTFKMLKLLQGRQWEECNF